MTTTFLQHAVAWSRWNWIFIGFAALSSPTALAAPYVEFDFARTAEARDVTPVERVAQYPSQRLVEISLPVSVRFRGVPLDDVDELTVEINAATTCMRVHDFAPRTRLASDIDKPIETTTTTKSDRSLEGTLGGALPVPFGAEVARVTPSISAGTGKCETVTEKLNRLPPKYAVVVSGTSNEGRGVFFKLKRSSQTSLEGVHELAVTFVVPAGWRGGDVHVGCAAGGQRKVLFMKQTATLGAEGAPVRVYLVGHGNVRHVAKPVASGELDEAPPWQPTRSADAAAVATLVKDSKPNLKAQDAANDGAAVDVDEAKAPDETAKKSESE